MYQKECFTINEQQTRTAMAAEEQQRDAWNRAAGEIIPDYWKLPITRRMTLAPVINHAVGFEGFACPAHRRCFVARINYGGRVTVETFPTEAAAKKRWSSWYYHGLDVCGQIESTFTIYDKTGAPILSDRY